jgi:D-glycero-alpha-D-manno-heptose-7-phosphate kinase
MIIEARAPTRIDLAGGTLDIHPLYLLEDDVWTVNAAVEIPVRVRLSPARQGYIIVSNDLDLRVEGSTLDTLPAGGPMDLVCRALRYAAPRPGLRVVLSSAAPKGSGLGASSALLVALLAALDRFNGRKRSRADLVMTAWRLEAQSLRTLTGRQDYLAAVHGGINAIGFGVRGDRVVSLHHDPALRRALQERLVIAYTGQPHASGLTNWGVVRAYLDGTPATIDHVKSIADVARRMRDALRSGRLELVAGLLDAEWSHRRELAPGVSTPVIARALAVARRHGALAGKACGAGGGGSVLVFVRAGAKRFCEDGLRAAGFAVLPTRIAPTGLQVRARL